MFEGKGAKSTNGIAKSTLAATKCSHIDGSKNCGLSGWNQLFIIIFFFFFSP